MVDTKALIRAYGSAMDKCRMDGIRGVHVAAFAMLIIELYRHTIMSPSMFEAALEIAIEELWPDGPVYAKMEEQ